MLSLVLSSVGCMSAVALAADAFVRHRRMDHLRQAVASVEERLEAFAATMADITTEPAARPDPRTAVGRRETAWRLGVELAAVRQARAATTKPFQQFARRTMRPHGYVLPQELAEPKGFAERAGLAADLENEELPVTLPQPEGRHGEPI
jgi:hypothetical protein